jgi:hypothetical protein
VLHGVIRAFKGSLPGRKISLHVFLHVSTGKTRKCLNAKHANKNKSVQSGAKKTPCVTDCFFTQNSGRPNG